MRHKKKVRIFIQSEVNLSPTVVLSSTLKKLPVEMAKPKRKQAFWVTCVLSVNTKQPEGNKNNF